MSVLVIHTHCFADRDPWGPLLDHVSVVANDPTHRYHNICRGERPDPSNHISTGKDLGPNIVFLTHFHTQNKCKYAHFGMNERDVNFTNKFIHTYQQS